MFIIIIMYIGLRAIFSTGGGWKSFAQKIDKVVGTSKKVNSSIY